ncbi:MAG: hypothetical protein LBR71_07365 [Synergistaceae bacterium]|jgi:hypothetical protein|nr:hypothetical protein [Synergistaceae bacterium]
MLEAGDDPLKRGKYSLEILDTIKERLPDGEKAMSFRNFAYNTLGIDKMDIDPEVKEVWKMQFRPVDEVVKELYIHDARREGIFETAQNFLKIGFPAEQVAQGTGLSLEELKSLQ